MNYYAEAIDIITKSGSLAHHLLVEIAKKNPSAIVHAHKRWNKSGWVEKVAPLLKSGQKLRAIKICRELTNMGLKEAKEACEAIEAQQQRGTNAKDKA